MFKKNYYGRLFKHFVELKVTSKKNVTHLIFSALLKVFTFLLIPFMAARIVDSVEGQDFEGALTYILLFATSAIIYLVCHHYNFWAAYKNANYIHNALQKKILDKIASFDASYTANIPKEALVSTAFADVDEARKAPDFFCDTSTQIIGIIVNVIILCFVDLTIGLMAAVLMVISMVIFIRHTKKRDQYRFIQREHADDISDLYSQIIDGYKEVKTMNMREDLMEYLDNSKQSWRKYHKKQRLHRDLAVGVVPIIIGFGRVLVYLVCTGLILKGEYAIAMLVLVVGYYEDILTRYDKICNAVDNISRSSIAIERLHRLFNFKTPHMVEFGEHDEDNIEGQVEFSHVRFTYSEPPKKAPDGTVLEVPIKKAPSFKDLSFKIKPQTLTAIVGRSGSGKSTIFRLLLRLYKIDKGEILLDNVNIYDYTKDVYASNVSIVSQRPFVFDMTIRENLNLVNKDHEAQIAACKKVGIHSVIMKFENGYDTVLRRDAENLSVEQKQLLALARALLSRSEVLLFDEITSNLDVAASEKIVSVLEKLKKDHTVIMITHNPDLMQQADDIIVVDKGRLAGQGTHKKLLRSCKTYKELQKY